MDTRFLKLILATLFYVFATVSCAESGDIYDMLLKQQDEIDEIKGLVMKMGKQNEESANVIAKLVMDNEANGNKIAKLVSENEAYRCTIAKLELANGVLATRMELFENEVGMLKANVKALETKDEPFKIDGKRSLNNVESSMGQINDTVSDVIEDKTKNVKIIFQENDLHIDTDKKRNAISKSNGENVHALKQNRRQTPSRAAQVQMAAFTASLSETKNNIGSLQTIVFDYVRTNVGNGYSKYTGIFTATTYGTYFFLATIMSDNIETELVLNGEPVALVYSVDSQAEQGTNGIVLVLSAGNTVWVRQHVKGSTVYGGYYSSFTGFQIN